jgi:hypothetical protein
MKDAMFDRPHLTDCQRRLYMKLRETQTPAIAGAKAGFALFVRMDSERISATEAATVAATVATSEPRIEIVTERRPAYSAAFRARVVAESSAPGAGLPTWRVDTASMSA